MKIHCPQGEEVKLPTFKCELCMVPFFQRGQYGREDEGERNFVYTNLPNRSSRSTSIVINHGGCIYL